MDKKLIYIANMRFPNERPHGTQIVETCEALKKCGVYVELWTAARKGSRSIGLDKALGFFDVKNKFTVKRLFVLDFLPSYWKIGFYLESLSFFISVFFKLLIQKGEFVVYTRDEIILFLALLLKRDFFWEAHMTPRSKLFLKNRLKKLGGIVAISKSLKNLIAENYKIDSKKILVAHDAVDLEEFSDFLSKERSLRLLKLPKDKKIVVYIGGLFKQKGIYTLLESAKLFGSEFLFLVVGGMPGDETEDVKSFIEKNEIKNVVLVGYVPHGETKKYLSVADVLLLPNSAKDERTNLFTSPLKLFEYMSSRKPIVASATVTIKEVLENNENAILVDPDDPEKLAEGINKIFRQKDFADKIAKQARLDVEKYTWHKRAEKIINFIKI